MNIALRISIAVSIAAAILLITASVNYSSEGKIAIAGAMNALAALIIVIVAVFIAVVLGGVN